MFVTIRPEELVAKPVNPMIYGNFIELGFGRQVDGMWSELLFNRSFEKITPYGESVWSWLNRSPQDDLSKEDWWHSGYEENPWYQAPGNPQARYNVGSYWGFHHGVQMAILTNPSKSKRAVLAQDGIFVRRNMGYRFSGYLMTGEDIALPGGPVIEATVGLYREGKLSQPLVERKIIGIGTDWKKTVTTLLVSNYEGRATFAVSIPPQSKLRLDGLSLLPSDNILGWRKEVVKVLRQVRPRIIRFPGGCFASTYNWRDGIGPHIERRPKGDSLWGGLENNDVGTAEFISLCRKIDAEPFICVNVLTGTPAEAADWVAYCNAPANKPLGVLRKTHGYAKPFKIKYWELDNETYRRFSALEYARRAVEFSRAMKKEDPSIQVVMVGYWRFHEFLPEMLKIAGPYIDLITERSGEETHLRKVLAIIRKYNQRSGRNIRLCNTEWLAPTGDVPVKPDALNRQPTKHDMTLQNQQIRWKYAMNAAKQLLIFQRLGGDFEFATFNNMANTWGQNVIECPKEGVCLSAAGRVFELFSNSPAAWPLKIERTEDNPDVATQAAWGIEKKQLILIVLNYGAEDTEIVFDLTQLGLKVSKADISILSAPSPASFNTFLNPNEIQRKDISRKLPSGTRFRFSAPSNSVAHIVLHK